MELRILLAEATSLMAELDKFRPLGAEIEARILQKFRLDWNYHSNHIEGNKLTYGETKALILFGITAKGKTLQEHLETSGHDEAVKWLIEIVKSETEITETFIRQLHELILKNPYQKEAITPSGQKTSRWIKIGQYKTEPNHVITKTGEMFYFATPEETPAKMHDLMLWFRAKKEDNSISPILLAAEFHHKFIRIHPFDDGNGRMARLLMNFILMQFGLPPAIIKTEDKENYYAALQQADAGILADFVSYIAQNVIHSLELMLKAAKGESIEDPDDLDKEIALLENKIKAKGEKIEKVKTKKVLSDWSNNILYGLIEKFIAVNEKFKKFYINTKYELFHHHWKYDIDENGEYIVDKSGEEIILPKTITEIMPKNFRDRIKTNLERSYQILIDENQKEKHFFKLICHFNTFNRTIVESFDYSFSIKISFEQTKYHITGEKIQKTLTKLYHQKPTDEELNYILQAEAKAHLQFIEQQTEMDSIE